jgi:hypothetical protein
MSTIKFTTTTHGVKRAFIMYPRSFRWLPIAVDKAEYLLANDRLVELHNA